MSSTRMQSATHANKEARSYQRNHRAQRIQDWPAAQHASHTHDCKALTSEAPQLPEEQQRRAQYAQHEPERKTANVSQPASVPTPQSGRAGERGGDAPAGEAVQPLRAREPEGLERRVALEELGLGDRACRRLKIKPPLGCHAALLRRLRVFRVQVGVGSSVGAQEKKV